MSDDRNSWVCLVSGAASPLLGLGALVYVPFGPFYKEASVTPAGSPVPTASRGLLEEGVEWPVALLLAAIALLLSGVAIGALLCWNAPRRAGAVLMIRACAILLVLMAGFTFVTVGAFFVPAVAAAILSALAAQPGSPTVPTASS